MDNALGLWALDAVSVNVAHHVVTAALFFFFGDFEVDVLLVGLQFVHLLLRNREAEFHFGFGEVNPQLAPSLELVLRAEDETHFLAGVTLDKRAFELITHDLSFFEFYSPNVEKKGNISILPKMEARTYKETIMKFFFLPLILGFYFSIHRHIPEFK